MNLKDLIEPERYAELSELGDDFILELLVELKTSVAEQIEQYDKHIQDGETAKTQFDIHGIKGAILNVGLKGLSADIIGLNELAVAGDFDEVQVKFPVFVQKFQEIIKQI